MPSEKVIRIHLLWAIAVLIMVMSAILWRLPDGDSLARFIAFAASIASLILAVVAIFYSMISNNQLTSNLQGIEGASASLEDSSEAIQITSENLLKRIEDLFEEVVTIHPGIEGIRETLESNLKSLMDNDESKFADNQDYGENFLSNNTTTGMNMSVYLVAMSAKHQKRIVFDDLDVPDPLRQYAYAAISALAAITYRGLILRMDRNGFEVVERGDLNPEKIIARAEERESKTWIKVRKGVSAYLHVADSADEDSAESSE
ncbi:hypothetical protein [Parasphingopyxis sp.]|uniref:hypothetical protein n=1 Tax=Parasphingopyxis sp. TaxID=1920299 RepID=UPI00261A94F9|nr:hypothetical protein [Parasphingopyxis sp.]